MRALLVGSFALAATAACNPYDPSLPPTPFRCGDTDPVCPSGYSCDTGLCVSDTDRPDASGPPDSGCADQAEPNNMLNQATNGAVFDQLDHITLEGLSLCPMMDTDLFHLNQPTTCGGATACPNLDVQIEFEDQGGAPVLAVLNSSGTVVQMGAVIASGTIKATFNNVPQGQYYVRVTSQPVLAHYRLLIDGRRTQ